MERVTMQWERLLAEFMAVEATARWDSPARATRMHSPSPRTGSCVAPAAWMPRTGSATTARLSWAGQSRSRIFSL